MVTNNSVNEPTAASGKVLQGQGVGTTSAFSTATYPAVATGTGKILRADGTNWVATTATFPDTAGTSGNVLTSDGTNWSSAVPATGGTVTTVSVVTANGLAGTVANATTTPAITLTTSATGILTGNGTAISGNTVTQHGVLIGGATNAASSLGVASTGTVLTGVTGADPAFSAAPAVTSITLSSGTALNKYVQGTWTPALVFGGSTTGFVYATRIGYYTQIGNVVYIQCDITLSTKGSGTGAVTMSGLPVTSGAVATTGNTALLIAQLTPITLVGSTSCGFNVDTAATTMSGVVWNQATGANAGMTTTNTTFSNNTTMRFQGFYFSS